MQKTYPKNIAAHAKSLLEPVVESAGLELYDIEYLQEHGRKVLRLYIEKDGGVDLNDCEKISRLAETELDKNDPVTEPYILEVSSPGIERKLVKPAHFAKHIGREVSLKLSKPLLTPLGKGVTPPNQTNNLAGGVIEGEKRKKFTGILEDYKDGHVKLAVDGASLTFAPEQIIFCRLTYQAKDKEEQNG